MSLYSDPTDAASHAVRFVLAEKAINVEIHHVTTDNKPEDLNDLNPYSAILTLVDRELVLYEPQIIMEYLDERFPHPPLMPVDPVSRANNRLYRYRLQRDFYALVDDLEHGNKVASNAAKKCLRDHLSTLAPIFAQKTYFMSDDYSLVDCYLAPILWRLPAYGVRLPANAKALQNFADRIFEREAFTQSLTEAEYELRGG
jgi:RNA polymerase-associated protein